MIPKYRRIRKETRQVDPAAYSAHKMAPNTTVSADCITLTLTFNSVEKLACQLFNKRRYQGKVVVCETIRWRAQGKYDVKKYEVVYEIAIIKFRTQIPIRVYATLFRP